MINQTTTNNCITNKKYKILGNLLTSNRLLACYFGKAGESLLIIAIITFIAVALNSSERVLAQSPAQVGQWSEVVQWPFTAVHAHVLPNGKVLFWSTHTHGHHGAGSEARIWDPITNQIITVDNSTTNVFCGGHSFLPDGKLLVTGGHLPGNLGIKDTNVFDFQNNQWTRTPDMAFERWYPTNVTLGNGEVVVVGGWARDGDRIGIPEIYQTNSGGTWRPLTGANRQTDLYPWLHLAPNGKVFNSGASGQTFYLDVNGDGAWQFVANTNFGYRGEFLGSSVMYEPGKVLILGGAQNGAATATSEKIDLTVDNPTWTSAGSMAFNRQHPNATVLPDGQVLVTGGYDGAWDNQSFPDPSKIIYAGEMWNPASGNWTTMASMTVPRLYHSTAVLLPDARVLVAGGGPPPDNVVYPDMQIYSPPYLFKGERPTIENAPEAINYNQTFNVGTPNAANIQKVTLVGLSSVTHSFNQNQRFINLAFTKSGDTLSVSSPAHGNLAPPGHYMLFVLNDQGVPSISKIVKITADPVVTLGNQAPIAEAQTITTFEDASGQGIQLSGSDPEGNTLAYTVVSQPAHGGLNGTAPNLLYTPNPDFFGNDSFTFMVNDGVNNSSVATINIVVSSINDAPVANADGFNVQEDNSLTGNVLSNDTDADIHPGHTDHEHQTLSAVLVSNPASGSLNLNPNGSFVYTPVANFSGNISFSYKANDGVADGNAATVTIAVQAVNDAPSANAGGPYNGIVGQVIQFNGSGSDADGSIGNYSWNFGDGSNAVGANPTHVYANPGNYTVTLKVTDNGGATATVTTTANITTAAPNQAPTANAGGPYNGTVGQAIQFNSAGSNDFDGSIVSYSWNFGDGTTGSGPSPTHAYSSAGQRTVTLTVTDNLGGTSTDMAQVNIIATTSPLTAPQKLKARAEDNYVELEWDYESNVTNFRIERSRSASSGFQEIGTASNSAHQFKDYAIQEDTTYYYRVRAFGNNQYSTYSSITSVKTRKSNDKGGKNNK